MRRVSVHVRVRSYGFNGHFSCGLAWLSGSRKRWQQGVHRSDMPCHCHCRSAGSPPKRWIDYWSIGLLSSPRPSPCMCLSRIPIRVSASYAGDLIDLLFLDFGGAGGSGGVAGSLVRERLSETQRRADGV